MVNQDLKNTVELGQIPRQTSPRVSSKLEIDQALADLEAHKQEWADLGINERINLFRETLDLTKQIANQFIKLDIKNCLIPENSLDTALSYVQVSTLFRCMHLYLQALEDIKKFGRPHYSYSPVILPNGQVSLQIFPETLKERILYYGVKAEIWFEPGVQPGDLPGLQARPYHTTPREGKIALVLGTGNYASLAIVDILYKLINELRVVILKVHPLTEFVGEIIKECFAPFVKAGFLRIVYGGAGEGEYIATRPQVDEIHMTGGLKTFETVIFGSGVQGEENKRNRKPRFNKVVTGELGNVTPVIVVPGPWTKEDIEKKAENIFANMVINNGYTCICNRLMILPENWSASEEMYKKIRQLFHQFERPVAYYPGSEQRIREAIKAHPGCEVIGEFSNDKTPWVFASHLKADKRYFCFEQEVFGSFYGGVDLAANSTPEFIDKAVEFCNETLWGTLGISIVVHPESLKDPAIKAAIDRAIANLRYGTIGVNTIAGLGYMIGRSGWGGYPNSPYDNAQSGIGWVKNILMFDRIQKTVTYGPFHFPLNFTSSPDRLTIAKASFEYERTPSWLNFFNMLFKGIMANIS